jgi:holo-[acyl-carrier protein] synthase
MIIGIGSDLANIERIEKSIQKYGERFLNKAFSQAEIDEMEKRKKVSLRRYASAAAKKFAAKEACSKALGTGFRRGVFLSDIEILHQPSGKPQMTLHNGALKRLHEIAGEDALVHVTMTDDYPWAQGFVILENP